MRSSELSLDQYPTDKISRGFMRYYDPILEPWVGKKISLLELGVYYGGSLLLWRDYFPLGTIVGIDHDLTLCPELPDCVRVFRGEQGDTEFLSHVANEVAPDGFDIIIDDCSHLGELTRTSFWHLFDNHLKADGLYVIEDWVTGYWANRPEGRSPDSRLYSKPGPEYPSHNYGMVGLIKQLIDKLSTRAEFDHMVIVPGIVFIQKMKAGVE